MAKDKYRHLANLEFQVGNAQDLTFSEQQFDLVISTGSIKHWPNPEQGVREMLRVLKKSGVSILVETDPVTSHQKALHFVEHWHYGFAQWPRLSSRYFRRYIAESSPSLAMMQSWFERAAGKVMQASPHATYPFNVIVAAIKE
jgi:ubiquinone/menaquinone biosynthesis C-methylase UbiE